MKSMTGFGKGTSSDAGGGTVSIEISSVNRKQLEIRTFMPQDLAEWEGPIRHAAGARISRGMVSVRIDYENMSSGGQFAVNEPLLKELTEKALAMQRFFGLPQQLDIAALMAIPGVVGKEKIEAENPGLIGAMEKALLQALDNFDAMRITEGAALKKDLAERLEKLKEYRSQILPQVQSIGAEQKTRLLARLAEEKLPADADDERFLKEIVFYLDKSDVSEELTRLSSHFEQFEAFLNSENPSGRGMDFLIQEMFREITTLGNKAGKSGIGAVVVAFKTELEKIREQIQNVE